MKLVQSLIIAAALAIPAVSSFAQSNAPVTRAQVRAELVQLEKAGYQPGRDDPQYPRDIQAAEARVSAQNAAAGNSYGGVADTASASGARIQPAFAGSTRSLYAGH
jgi:Domain of unknown function (DUF4148)